LWVVQALAGYRAVTFWLSQKLPKHDKRVQSGRISARIYVGLYGFGEV
jgi:hypothetical protein